LNISNIYDSISKSIELVNEMGPEVQQVIESMSTEQDLLKDIEQIQLIADLPYEIMEDMCSLGDELLKLYLLAASGNMKVKSGLSLLSQELRQLLAQLRAGHKVDYKRVKSIVSVTFGSSLLELMMGVLVSYSHGSILTNEGAVPVPPSLSVTHAVGYLSHTSPHVASANMNTSTDFIRDQAVGVREFLKTQADL
jgi:hypothetical protein